MRIKNGFVVREVCAQKVVLAEGTSNIDFGKLLTLNDTAEFLWNQAESQGDFTVESLTTALCGEYDVDSSMAAKDVKHIVDLWKQYGILE